jgi:hypothetical protein
VVPPWLLLSAELAGPATKGKVAVVGEEAHCIRENGWKSSKGFETLELPELPKHCGAVLWSLQSTVRAPENEHVTLFVFGPFRTVL